MGTPENLDAVAIVSTNILRSGINIQQAEIISKTENSPQQCFKVQYSLGFFSTEKTETETSLTITGIFKNQDQNCVVLVLSSVDIGLKPASTDHNRNL